MKPNLLTIASASFHFNVLHRLNFWSGNLQITTAVERSIHVLLVDDEPRLRTFLKEELELEGYQVNTAGDAACAWEQLDQPSLPELLVLDWNLPDGSGLELCQRMRKAGINLPVLMLTGHDDVSDRVLALDAGVDDYLVKPFSVEELLARLRALQRRRWEAEQSGPDQLLLLGRLELNTTAKTAVVDGLTLPLLTKEYELLELLMLADGQPRPVRDLLVSLWQEAGLAEPDVLDVYLCSLGAKLLSADSLLELQTTINGGWSLSQVDGAD